MTHKAHSIPENNCAYAHRVMPAELPEIADCIIQCTNPDRKIHERFPGIKLCVCTAVHYGDHNHKMNAEIKPDDMHGCRYRGVK